MEHCLSIFVPVTLRSSEKKKKSVKAVVNVISARVCVLTSEVLLVCVRTYVDQREMICSVSTCQSSHRC